MNFLMFLAPVLGPVLGFIYNLVNNYGLAIILFTIVIKLVLFPLTIKQQKSTAEMAAMKPEIDAINKKYKDDKEKLQKEMMALYQKHGVNPAAGCLPMLIQLPILFALYRVIYMPLTYILNLSSDTVNAIIEKLELPAAAQQIEIASKLTPENIAKLASAGIEGLRSIDFNFLWLDLARAPQMNEFSLLWLIPILAGATTYFSSKMMTGAQPSAGGDTAASMNKNMMVIFPIFTVWICFSMPSGVGLYWVISNVLSMLQQYIYNIMKSKKSESGVKND